MTFTCKQSGRLDAIMSKELSLPRNQIEQLIKQVGVKVDNKEVKKSGLKLKGDEVIEYDFVEAKKEKEHYEVNFDIDVLYEDEDILVINKPPFLTVHPAPSVKEATVVDWLIKRGISLSTISGDERHGIVHRIDKETSGALVIAKNNEAHMYLSRQLEDKSMGRYYLAITDIPLKENTIVDKPIGRNRKNRLKMDVVQDGREAKSAFCKLALSKSEKIELIGAKLFTGRTHQIRVHLSALSRHILGDSLYGFKSQKSKIARVMLHAYILYLQHPKTGEFMQVIAPPFEDFENVLKKHFNKDEIDEKIDSSYIIKRFNTFC
ncbi:RluA family pseudouridine synthase [Sulfurospirillum arcachonense]|uniref:RluA family pseudouridine synthase n=1 Tax=Sulfurospirillum arcachonense TaxID=57666 RepID=UPI0004685739|nr:RluA family pseudouridine synthase [Sulfurospirillum arcachonense]